MLWNLSSLFAYSVLAVDGFFGGVREFLFDEENWNIQYVVVELDVSAPGQKVLLPVLLLDHPDEEGGNIPVSLTKAQILSNSAPDRKGEPHLKGTGEATGCRIVGIDGEIGSAEDFIIDDAWVIRYIVVAAGEWLQGRSVLLTPQWIHAIDWQSRTITVDVTREYIEKSPAYDPSLPLSREYEDRFYEYYGCPRYWG